MSSLPLRGFGFWWTLTAATAEPFTPQGADHSQPESGSPPQRRLLRCAGNCSLETRRSGLALSSGERDRIRSGCGG